MHGSAFIGRKVYVLRSVGGIAAERGEHQNDNFSERNSNDDSQELLVDKTS